MSSFESSVQFPQFAAAQRWVYRTSPGLETSRIVIGAIVTFNGGRIFCCSVMFAGRALPDGQIERVHIPFLPLTEEALVHTVEALDGSSDLPPTFAARLQEWTEDPRGMTTFTVPFDGYLDHLINSQVAVMAGVQAA